jgi:hypothetical protein
VLERDRRTIPIDDHDRVLPEEDVRHDLRQDVAVTPAGAVDEREDLLANRS